MGGLSLGMEEKLRRSLQKIVETGYYSFEEGRILRAQQILKYMEDYLKVVDEQCKMYIQEWEKIKRNMKNLQYL